MQRTTIIGLMAAVICLAAAPATAAEKTAGKQNQRIRTLDAIEIEGEIAVPQVLFISGRDVRRYRDGLDWKLRKNTLDVVGSLDLPTRLRIVAKPKEEK